MSEDTPDATPRFRGPVESALRHLGKKITGVAIRSEDLLVHSLPPPYRHGDVIAVMVREKGYPRPVTGEQGFVLEDGTFLDRVQSWRVAKHANQILPGKGGHRGLYSEDESHPRPVIGRGCSKSDQRKCLTAKFSVG